MLHIMKKKLYLETTIPSYLTARPSRDLIVAGHQEITRQWWQNRKDDFEIYVSQLVLDEAIGGDKDAAQRRIDALEGIKILEVSEDSKRLAKFIIEKGAVPAEAAIDAAHIAIAAVCNMDFLMTWNCTHIANAEMFFAVADVCETNGFKCPIICTPEELIGIGG